LGGQFGGGDVFETATVSANGGAHTADHNNFTTHAFFLLCDESLIVTVVDAGYTALTRARRPSDKGLPLFLRRARPTRVAACMATSRHWWDNLGLCLR
jgi:hypothetical protein